MFAEYGLRDVIASDEATRMLDEIDVKTLWRYRYKDAA